MGLIDTMNEEADKAKVQHEKQLNAAIANIQMYDKEFLEQRSDLLVAKHNGIKGQELGRVFKSNLENNMEEFKSVTGVLRLTKMSLHEVEDALAKVSNNLKAFKVALDIFKTELKSYVERFQAVQESVDACKVKDFGTKTCQILEHYIMAT